MTRSDHGITHAQALHNFDPPRLAQADFDGYTLRNERVGFVTRHQFDHKSAAALRNDGFFGDHQCVFTCPKNSIDPRKHAGPQLLIAVVDAGTHTDRAPTGLNQRVHRLNSRRERAAGQGIQSQLCFLASTHFGLKALWQTEIEQHRIDVFHVHHVRTVFQVVAHVDLLEARDAIKWRQHFEPLQRGIGQSQLGPCHIQSRTALVQRAFTDEILRHQLLVAFVVGLGNGQFGLGLSDLGLLQLVFKLHHHLALAHALAIAKEYLLDTPTDFGPQHHPLQRTQTAHRLGLVHQGHGLHFGHFNSGRFGRSSPCPWARCDGNRGFGCIAARVG